MAACSLAGSHTTGWIDESTRPLLRVDAEVSGLYELPAAQSGSYQ